MKKLLWIVGIIGVLVLLVGPVLLPMLGNHGQIGVAMPGGQLNQCQAIGQQSGCVAQVDVQQGGNFNLNTGDNPEFAPPPLTSTSEQTGTVSPLFLLALAIVIGSVIWVIRKKLLKQPTPTQPPVPPTMPS